MKKIALFFTPIFILFFTFLVLEIFYQEIYWPDYITPRSFFIFEHILIIIIWAAIYSFLEKRNRKGIPWFLAGCGVILFSLIAASIRSLDSWEEYKLSPKYKIANQIKRGMDEKEVYKLLGTPFKVYEKETAPEDYYLKGYKIRKRKITHKVLIYKASYKLKKWRQHICCYIYLDRANKVEYISICGGDD
jgi:phosphoglycerol transferase MdoB-like AlkP superfamily enzyme